MDPTRPVPRGCDLQPFGTIDCVALIRKQPCCDCAGCLRHALEIAAHLVGYRRPRWVSLRRGFAACCDACAAAILDQHPWLSRWLPVPATHPEYLAWVARLDRRVGRVLWLAPAECRPAFLPPPPAPAPAFVAMAPRLGAMYLLLHPLPMALEAISGTAVAVRTDRIIRRSLDGMRP